MGWEWSDEDIANLGFDKKVQDLSESSLDSWNRNWFEDRKGNKILVREEKWYLRQEPNGHWFRILTNKETVSEHFSSVESLKIRLKKLGL